MDTALFLFGMLAAMGIASYIYSVMEMKRSKREEEEMESQKNTK
jgi:hypothetical protein